jgi:hypothetical protein
MGKQIIIWEDGTVQYTAKKVTRLSPGKYAAILPSSLNDVWRVWHERGIKLLVIVKPITNPNQKPSGRASGGARGSTWPASVLDLGGQGPGKDEGG